MLFPHSTPLTVLFTHSQNDQIPGNSEFLSPILQLPIPFHVGVISCCCIWIVTNLPDKNNTRLLVHSSVGQKSNITWLSSLFGAKKCSNQGFVQAEFSLAGPGEKFNFQALWRCWKNSVSCSGRTSCWLSAWGLSQRLEAAHIHSHLALSTSTAWLRPSYTSNLSEISSRL